MMTRSAAVFTAFSPADIEAFKPEMKIGILATLNGEGQPHLTLISTLQAASPTQMCWGQFTEGTCKQFIRDDPRAGFLIMTLDKQLWRGKANFTHTARHGPEFERYNNTPMFRYNAYFGVHTVYYMHLLEHSGRTPLPMGRIVPAAIKTMLAGAAFGTREKRQVLNPWTRQLMNKLSNLKFVGYVGADGYPAIIPAIQAQAPDREHVIFSTSVYGEELHAIPAGSSVAVFGMSLSMEDVLLRGTYAGTRRIAGLQCGVVGVNWVYNPMPPKPQQIYPELELEPVSSFS